MAKKSPESKNGILAKSADEIARLIRLPTSHFQRETYADKFKRDQSGKDRAIFIVRVELESTVRSGRTPKGLRRVI